MKTQKIVSTVGIPFLHSEGSIIVAFVETYSMPNALYSCLESSLGNLVNCALVDLAKPSSMAPMMTLLTTRTMIAYPYLVDHSRQGP
jgi:hypothetical protein